MKKIITVSMVRFNQDDGDSASFIISDTTSFEVVKSAVLKHVKSIKEYIVGASENHYEDGEEDGFESVRLATYNEIISGIEACTLISDFHYFGRFSLEDGNDVDTEEEIISHITIWSVDGIEL